MLGMIGKDLRFDDAIRSIPVEVRSRISSKIEQSPFCWLWKAALRNGYGAISINGVNSYAHRFIFEFTTGNIPKGLELDHLCIEPSCVRPSHLQVVTHRENVLRGESPSAKRARSTHCKLGHPLSEENLGFKKQKRGAHRWCVICRRRQFRENYARHRTDKLAKAKARKQKRSQ